MTVSVAPPPAERQHAGRPFLRLAGRMAMSSSASPRGGGRRPDQLGEGEDDPEESRKAEAEVAAEAERLRQGAVGSSARPDLAAHAAWLASDLLDDATFFTAGGDTHGTATSDDEFLAGQEEEEEWLWNLHLQAEGALSNAAQRLRATARGSTDSEPAAEGGWDQDSQRTTTASVPTEFSHNADPESPSDAFLRRLRESHAEAFALIIKDSFEDKPEVLDMGRASERTVKAVAAGDLETAAAIADAIRAEGAVLKEERQATSRKENEGSKGFDFHPEGFGPRTRAQQHQDPDQDQQQQQQQQPDFQRQAPRRSCASDAGGGGGGGGGVATDSASHATSSSDAGPNWRNKGKGKGRTVGGHQTSSWKQQRAREIAEQMAAPPPDSWHSDLRASLRSDLNHMAGGFPASGLTSQFPEAAGDYRHQNDNINNNMTTNDRQYADQNGDVGGDGDWDFEQSEGSTARSARVSSLRAGRLRPDLLHLAATRTWRAQQEPLIEGPQGPPRASCGPFGTSFESGGVAPNEWPSSCRRALEAWTIGRISGARCLLELSSVLPSDILGGLRAPGLPSWNTLACLCGLAGGEALATDETSPLWSQAFGRTPSEAFRLGLGAASSEAQVRLECISPEEIHLGFRALELQCKSGGTLPSTMGLLTVQAWRDIVRLRLSKEFSFPAQAYGAAGQEVTALRDILSSDPTKIAEDAATASQDELRALPGGWEDLEKALRASLRTLREALDSMKLYGPYATLGVDVSCSAAALKKAYRDLCLVHHPDKGGDTVAFQQLQQAYEKIVDERKRGVAPPPPPPTQQQQQQQHQQAPSRSHAYQQQHQGPTTTSSPRKEHNDHHNNSNTSPRDARADPESGYPHCSETSPNSSNHAKPPPPPRRPQAAEGGNPSSASSSAARDKFEGACADAEDASTRASAGVEAATAAAKVIEEACNTLRRTSEKKKPSEGSSESNEGGGSGEGPSEGEGGNKNNNNDNKNSGTLDNNNSNNNNNNRQNNNSSSSSNSNSNKRKVEEALADFCFEVVEVSPELEAAMKSIMEDAMSASAALEAVAASLLPACPCISDGEVAEEVIEITEQCMAHASQATMVANTTGCLAQEVAQTLEMVTSDLRQQAPNPEELDIALKLISSGAARGKEAAEDTAAAAAAAAALAQRARELVEKATGEPGCGRREATRRSSARSPRQKQDHASQGSSTPGVQMPPRAPGAGGRTSPETGGKRTPRQDNTNKQQQQQQQQRQASAGAASPPPSGRDWDWDWDGDRGGGGENSSENMRGRRSGRSQQPGSARARSGSAGVRGWREALVSRRVQFFEQLKALDTEAQKLQGELHQLLLQSPLLLKDLVSAPLRSRLLALVADILVEEVLQFSTGDQELPLKFLVDGSSCSLVDARVAALRLASMVDCEAVQSLLSEQFSTKLLEVRACTDKEAEAVRARIKSASGILKSWVLRREGEDG